MDTKKAQIQNKKPLSLYLKGLRVLRVTSTGFKPVTF